jgi:hypothetical protein
MIPVLLDHILNVVEFETGCAHIVAGRVALVAHGVQIVVVQEEKPNTVLF